MRTPELQALIGHAPWLAKVTPTGFKLYFGHPQWLHVEHKVFPHPDGRQVLPRRTYAVIGATNFLAAGVRWRARVASRDGWISNESVLMEQDVAMAEIQGQVLIDFHLDTADARTTLEFDLGGVLVIEPDPDASGAGDIIWVIEDVRSGILVMLGNGCTIKDPEDFSPTRGTSPV